MSRVVAQNPFQLVILTVSAVAALLGLAVDGAGSPTINALFASPKLFYALLLAGAGTATASAFLRSPMSELLERVGLIWYGALLLGYGIAVLIMGDVSTLSSGVVITGLGLSSLARLVQIDLIRRSLGRRVS